MATPVIMPRQGQSVESCIISKWHKKKGDSVKAGELLFSYETDKAAFDEEAKIDGIILDIFFLEGDDVPVLTNVCVIGNEGESAMEFNPNVYSSVPATLPTSSSVSVQANPPKSDGNLNPETLTIPVANSTAIPYAPISLEDIKISPRARNLADKTGIDYRYAAPSGPNDRIIERDIIAMRDSGPVFTKTSKENSSSYTGQTGTGIGGRITNIDLASTAQVTTQASTPATTQTQTTDKDILIQTEFEEVKVSNIRKVIAKAMFNSLSTTAQLTLNSSFDATDILEYRKRLKENKDKLGLANITITDMILYATAKTLMQHRNLNANYLGDKMLLFKNVNLGCAVDTERGLMVPTIFNANLKSLNEISIEVKKLAEECQKGTINPDQLKGGSFTVSNLGALGIESFTPVINPPQTGILGVNTIVTKVKEVNGNYVYYPSMTLSLTFNHMAIDGAPAARFLQDLKNNLENFSLLLVK